MMYIVLSMRRGEENQAAVSAIRNELFAYTSVKLVVYSARLDDLSLPLPTSSPVEPRVEAR